MVRFSYSRLNSCLHLIKLGPNYATDLKSKARHMEQTCYSFASRAQRKGPDVGGKVKYHLTIDVKSRS